MSGATRYGDPLFDVSDHLVVITGALGLIGRELTRAFLARGARVVQVDTTFDQPPGSLEPVDEKCWAFECDVARSVAVEELCRKVVREFRSGSRRTIRSRNRIDNVTYYLLKRALRPHLP